MASIFIRTIIIYILVSISLKAMGKRQLGELEISELVSTLLISEVASLPIADPDIPLMNAIIPTVLIVCLEIIISTVKNKSEKLKRYVEGEPTFVIYQGILRQDALRKHRISINELLCEIRMQGIADIKDVYYAILEQNGRITVIEKARYRQVSADDLGLSVNESGLFHIIIEHGCINRHGINRVGIHESSLCNELSRMGFCVSDIYLMMINDAGERRIIPKEKK